MKKIIALLLALVLCCGVFAGCNDQNAPGQSDGKGGATIEDALSYLKSSYKDDEGKKTSADYKMPAQIDIEGVKFTITWTSDNEAIKFVLENGLYVVDVPTKNETEVPYKLTATVKDAAGKTATAEFSRVLPVYDDGASVTKPVEGQAYKLFFIQGNLGKTLYCIGEAQNDKFIKTDVDPKKGADFYAEEVEGGYKFYTTINGEKMYLHAFTVTGDDDKVSKHISFAAESDAVYYYKTEVKTWFVKINNIEYGIGTYNDYATMSISEGTYFTADKVGVTQFCMTLITKEVAEEQEVSTGPADPTELSTITELAEKAGALADGTQTAEKYLVKGTVAEIVNDQYGNLYIEDEAGNRLYVYGVYDKTGEVRFDAMDPQPKVGDTVTLMGVLSNYKGDGQMKNGWVQELVPGTDTPVDPEPTDPEPTDPEIDPVTPSEEYASTPEVGKSYKLGLFQEKKGEVNYFIGEMKGYYGATSTDKSKAVDVTVESAGEGLYYLSFTVDGAKKYIGTEVSSSHLNFIIVDEANRAVFTWNDQYDTMTTVMSNGTEAFMGTYGDYYTFGMSAMEKIEDSYVGRLYN